MVWYMCVLTRPALSAFATANYNHIGLVIGKPYRNSWGDLGCFAAVPRLLSPSGAQRGGSFLEKKPRLNHLQRIHLSWDPV
jgi:hypothetical protein